MSKKKIPLSFRLSNGLEKLNFGEADIVCIAGMGVKTMIKILDSSSDPSQASDDSAGGDARYPTDLERIGCTQLLLQPTTSRPRNLIQLYDTLQKDGWTLKDERIEKLSSRYYITACFTHSERVNDVVEREEEAKNFFVRETKLPGSILSEQNDNSIFKEYCQHHITWLEQEAAISSMALDEADQRWLSHFSADE